MADQSRTLTENEFLLYDRLQKIQSIIKKYGEDNCYISFSGGKDSTVLSELTDLAVPGNRIERVFADTGIEYNMIRSFVFKKAENDDRFKIIKPRVPIKHFLQQNGYPFKSKHHSEMWKIWENNHQNLSAIKYRDGLYNFSSNQCPKILQYQFNENYSGVRISDACCFNLKEQPLSDYMKENNKTVAFVGIMRKEGGRRESAKCFVKYPDGSYHFHPLSVVTKEWEEWFISEYNIEICDIYKPPYNFERTGCKGCPYNVNLQDALDKMDDLERKQCEYIWKPVYAEYRRLGYRLRKLEQEDDESTPGQLSIFDLKQ